MQVTYSDQSVCPSVPPFVRPSDEKEMLKSILQSTFTKLAPNVHLDLIY